MGPGDSLCTLYPLEFLKIDPQNMPVYSSQTAMTKGLFCCYLTSNNQKLLESMDGRIGLILMVVSTSLHRIVRDDGQCRPWHLNNFLVWMKNAIRGKVLKILKGIITRKSTSWESLNIPVTLTSIYFHIWIWKANLKKMLIKTTIPLIGRIWGQWYMVSGIRPIWNRKVKKELFRF